MPKTLPPRSKRDARRGTAFANLITTARLRRRWTNDTLVAESGVSLSTIQRWQSGFATAPNPDQLRAVCTALGIDPREALIALGYLDRDEAAAPAPAIPDPPLSFADALQFAADRQRELDRQHGPLLLQAA
jgi:transcriptional regulator with XRE-family HTH domain